MHASKVDSTLAVDVLSDILQVAHRQSWTTREASFSAPWNLRECAGPITFYVVIEGQAELALERGAPPYTLGAGDLVVVVADSAHSLGSTRSQPAANGAQSAGAGNGASQSHWVSLHHAARVLVGRLAVDRSGIQPLLSSLPPLVHVPGVHGKPVSWLADALPFLRREAASATPGSRAVLDCLSQTIFAQAVRTCAGGLPTGQGNWLSAVMDPDVGLALGLMHTQPETPWTVASLAERSCLSRSTFAARFKMLLSTSPRQYLLECRMQKACQLLTEARCGIKEIAKRVGYATEAAFGHAFKRWAGTAPGAYRRSTLRNGKPNRRGDARSRQEEESKAVVV